MPIRQQSKIEAANQTALEIQKETQQLDQEISDIMDNQQSINVELDTSEQLERDLNKQIEEGQTKLDDLKHQESITAAGFRKCTFILCCYRTKGSVRNGKCRTYSGRDAKIPRRIEGAGSRIKAVRAKKSRKKNLRFRNCAKRLRIPENYLRKFRMRLKRRRRHVKI